jgi:hypothetical protein
MILNLWRVQESDSREIAMRSAGNFNSEWGYLAPAPSFMRTARVVLVATAIGATAGAAVVLSLIDRPAGERDKTASIAAHAIVTSVQAAPAMATLAPDSASGALAAPVKVTTAVPPKGAPAIQAALPAAQVSAPAPVALQAASAAAPPATPVVMPPPAATQSTAIAAPRPAPTNPSVSENADASGPSAVPVPAPKPASGFASLSAVPPATEAAPAELPDQALIPPQTVPPVKKSKQHAAYASSGKYQPTPGLGTVLRRLFSTHNGTSYYPNR